MNIYNGYMIELAGHKRLRVKITGRNGSTYIPYNYEISPDYEAMGIEYLRSRGADIVGVTYVKNTPVVLVSNDIDWRYS